MSRVKLGDVAREHKETIKGDKSNYPIVGLEHLIPENIRLTQWDYNKENTFTKVFRKGCVLFGRRRAYLKKAVYADFDGICSGDITIIEAIPGKILPELLPFVIQNDDLFDYAVGKSAGSLSPRVKWEHLKNYEFELPDVEKQHELAQILWSIVETKESYERLMAATDELVKSQFIELSKSGRKCLIRELCTPFSSNLLINKLQDNNGKYPLYGATGIVKGIDFYRQEDPYLSIIKWGAGVGRVELHEGKSSIVGSLQGIIPNDGVDINWLYYALKYSDLAKYATNTTVPNLYFKDYGELELIYPENMQKEIVSFIKQSDKSKFELENCIKNAVSMYKKILKEYLG